MLPGDVVEVEEEGAPPPAEATSSSPDEAVVGPGNLLPQDDFKALKDLLKRVALNLEMEGLREISQSYRHLGSGSSSQGDLAY